MASSNNHARPAAFQRFLQGDASPAEVQTIVRHLLASCASCRKRLSAARRAQGSPATWSYDAAFARLGQRVQEAASPEAPPARCWTQEAHP